MGNEDDYSVELSKLIGKNACEIVMAQLENDKLKRHVILEIAQRLEAGEEVYDELAKVFADLARNGLIDAWVEQDNKEE